MRTSTAAARERKRDLDFANSATPPGVAEHSTFRQGPVAAAQRLHHTVRTMLALTFGDAARQRHRE